MKEVDYSNFEQEVLQSSIPAVVDFYGEWCGPCKGFTTRLEKLAEEYSNKINFFKLNIDKNEEITEKYNIIGLPTMIAFYHGKEVSRKGNKSEADLRIDLNRLLEQIHFNFS